MILGFTGTRLGTRPAQTAAIHWFMHRLRPSRLVHGGASGADMVAHGIAESLGIPVIWIYPGDTRSSAVWAGMRAGIEIYPPLPPLERNRVMVKQIHGLLACPKSDTEELRSGTWSTVRYARAAGVPVYLIRANGKIVPDQQTFDKWLAPL